MHISFSPPDISEQEINEVAEALRSGWITTGPRTKQLEKNLAERIGVPGCVCLNSQTACAELALRIFGVGPGDEVITSAYTYTATASVALHVGATLRLMDTRKDGFEMDYDKLEASVNEKTKVIIPVDLGGVPCDYDKIFSIVERKRNLFKPSNKIQEAFGRIIVMADAAHALGAIYKGQNVGNAADFSNFSFHAVKNLTTAEGGAVTWKSLGEAEDREIYRMFQLYSLHGQSKDALSKTKLGAWEYDVLGAWYKCNMTDVAAAIGLKQLERYDGMLQRRKQIIEKYDCAFRPLGIKVLNHYSTDRQSSGHLYITRIPGITETERNEIIVKMAEEDIACNVHYKPLPMFTAYKNLGFSISDYPNAYGQYVNEITLPLHTSLTDEMVDYVAEKYVKIVKRVL